MKNITRVLLSITFLLISYSNVFSQTQDGVINAPGDIVFIAYHDSVDGIAFLFMDDCPAGTVIKFTDSEWTGTSFSSGEGDLTWTNNTGATIVKGTIVTVQDAGGNTMSIDVGSITESDTGFGTANGDQIYAMTGTRAAPGTFLAFVGEDQSVNGSETAVLTNTGLTAGITAKLTAFEAYYNGTTDFNGTAIAAATTINGATWPGTGGYTFPSANISSVSGSVFSSATTPTVSTTAASAIATTSATLAGDVTSDGGDTVTERGIVYSTSDTTPTIAEGATKDTNGSGTGVFSESISSLTAGTTYFFNSYAINSEGTSYGTPATFTTSTAEPTVAANTITQSSITSTTMTVGWTNGNGARRIVIAKSGSAVNANPIDATAGYSANASFGNGTDLGSSNFIVYDGTGTAVGLTGLTAGTTYHFKVIEFNGTSSAANYFLTGAPTSNKSTLSTEPTVAANTITQSSITSTTMTIGWTNGNGARRIVIAKSGSAVNANPIDATAGYSANASFGNGTDLGSSNFIVYDGTGTSVGLTGLTASTTYHFKVIEFNGTSSAANYFLTGAPTSNRATIATAVAPTVTTTTQTSVTTVSADLGGNVTSDGGASVTDRGIVWGTTSNPTISNTKVANSTGTGTFNATVTSLPSNTTIHVRAYATNSVGTSYGSNISFTTEQSGTSNFITLGSNDSGGTGFKTNASNTNYVVSNIMANDASSMYINDFTNGVSQTFTIKADGTNAESFSVDVFNVKSFSAQTFDQTSTVVFKDKSGATIQTMTLNTDKSLGTNPTSLFSFFDNGTTAPVDLVAEIVFTLVPTTAGQNVSNWTPKDITISNVVAPVANTAATVTTTAASSITATTASLGGNVTADGGATVTERGIVYSISDTTPTIAEGAIKNDNSSGTGVFSETVSSLTAGTTYYINSYAINSVGTSYGSATTFTTTAPTVTLGLSGSPLAENSGVATLTATLSAVSSQTVTVTIAPSGTATGSGTDYTLSNTTITINAGSTTGTATITGADDALDETNETVIIDITGVSNGTEEGTQQVTASITDDDAAPTVTLGLSGSPLAENSGVATLTATLSAVSSQTVTVTIAPSGTATGSGTDYTLSSTTITINAGSTTGTATITGADDALDETNETVIIDITGVSNGTEDGTQQVTASITDDDAAPTVTLGLSGSPLAENSGVATLTATLSAVSSQTVTVTIAPSGTATGSGTDYTLSNTTITINAGSTTGTATITGADDALDETNETVIIDITGVSNGTEDGTQQVTASITDDDAAPTVTLGLSGSPLAENGGVATLTATLSAVSSQTVTVTISPSGTATGSGTDYTLSNTTITINAGSTTGTATITGADDALDETIETVIIDITGVANGTESGTQQVTASITDDDDAPSVSLALSGSPFSENGGFSTIIASLNTVSSQTVTVTIAPSGTATGSGTDYTLSSTTITINAGSVSGTATITGVDDAIYEAAETVVIDITGVTNGTESSTQQVTAFITDDDLIPATITFANLGKTYGDANFDLTATSNSTGTISYSIIAGGTGSATLSGTNNATVTIENAGTVIIRATLPADGAYSSATKDINLTIAKRAITVTADANQKKTSGDVDPVFSYTITSGSIISGDVFTGALSREVGELAGPYEIEIGTLSAGSNYDLTFVSNDFVISIVLTTGYINRSSKAVIIEGKVSSSVGIIERGVVYSSTNTNPEIGGANVIKVIDDTFTGPFSVTINGLSSNTTYYFQTYVITNVSKGTAPSTFFGGVQNFTTLVEEPILVSKNPINSTLKVNPTLTISLVFDKDMQVGNGNILIKKTSDDSLVETIDVTSGNITIKNNIVQINPTVDLPQKTALYVIVPVGAFEDLTTKSWTGLLTKTDWTFTTDDTIAPTVTSISPTDNAIDVAPSSNLTVTFSEDMVKGTGNILVKKASDDSVIATLDVTSSEVTITNNVVTINPNTDLPSETAMYLEVPNTVFKDLYDNAYAGFSDTSTWNFTTADITSPTVTITTSVSNQTNQSFLATFTFSEDIKNFDLSDITLTNATASIFNQISNSKYTAIITPTTEGVITVVVDAGKLQDNSNNDNIISNTFSITYDITAPSLVITSDTTNPTNVSSFVATFTFSENVGDFDASFFTLINATTSNFVSVSDAIYTATITPIADGTVTINVEEDETEDYANNANTAAQYTTLVDTVKPTVTITSAVANPTNEAFTATFTFSKVVTGFDISDITLANATASDFTEITITSKAKSNGSNIFQYTALITPTSDGVVSIDVAADTANDAATNGNTAATQFNTTYDNTKPTVTITSADGDPTNTAITATFTFSENVTGFDISDVTIVNATASNFSATSSSVYTALITPVTDGNVTIDVANDVANDAATNGNIAATQFSVLNDVTNPTVVITSPVSDPTNSAFTTTFTFSEAVTGFVIGDISLANATASNFTATSSSVYTALITPTTDGNVTIDVTADVAADAATNKNTAATQFSVLNDVTNPTVTITSAVTDPTNSTFTTTFTFSEAVTGFDIGDITLDNATASNFTATSSTVYTALITPTTDGNVTIDVTAEVAADAATNGNTAATQFSVLNDITSPTITITSTVSDPTNSTFTTTFTFSEAVTDFVIGDITLDNAIASNFTATSSSVYTALITPTADGNVTIDVAANVAADAATNGNIAATQFSILYDTTAPDMPAVVNIDDYTCPGTTTTTADNTLVFNGTAEADASVEVFVNSTSIGTVTATSTGDWTFDYTSVTLADATYTVTATAKDAATNTSAASNAFIIIIDTIDTDDDGNPDFCDEDDDNDGVLDADDNSYLPNPDQADSNNNGIGDVQEDCDNDDILNYYDTDNTSCQEGIIMKKKYGFSPNGDGINDTWTIENIQLYPNNVVNIYNRSGKIVFTMKGYDNSFNGFSNKTSSNKKLPVGAYYFTVEFNTPGAKPAKGWIYINY